MFARETCFGVGVLAGKSLRPRHHPVHVYRQVLDLAGCISAKQELSHVVLELLEFRHVPGSLSTSAAQCLRTVGNDCTELHLIDLLIRTGRCAT